MANYMAEIFAPVEARYRAAVLAETWGHLAPKMNVKYHGHVLWALGCCGNDELNPTVLGWELTSRKGLELESSPWFFDYLIEFLQKQGREPGTVWRFDGWFRNYEFVGTIRQVDLK